MADTNTGGIAFHLIMSLLSDMAIHDEPRLSRMLDTLGRILENNPDWSAEQKAEVRGAYDALLRIGDTHLSGR